MSDNKKWSILIVLIFFIWGGISYQWYTCGIKGFCNTPNKKEIVKTTETTQCGEYLTKHIKLGSKNDVSEVRKLEAFLIQNEDANITIDGIYSKADELAVKAFQAKYRADILDPWGIAEPSGFVYKTTRNKINELYCTVRTSLKTKE